ncbi:putative quinol monooxygenase [Psychrobacter sp. 1Y11]|uniref:putative quinol monooxygenase n=1 Tax=Psychrobacter sp. 1Y11 TaxID=3457446 RepID=UPI003FD47DC3
MNTQEKQAITLVANITAKPEHAEEVKSELLKLAEASQAEQGAIHYNIHQNNAKPNHFITYEVWETKALMEQHGQSAHFQNFIKVTKEMIEDSNLTQMTRIA